MAVTIRLAAGVLLYVLVYSALLPPGVEGCGRGSVYLMNNGYRRVLIAVGEDVPEDPRLITRIKSVFTDTSAFLYNATRRRAYLQEINILIPKAWSRRPEYEAAGDEAIDKSDILVAAPESTQQGDTPFVIKSTPCGQLGHYMHLTPNFLLDPNVAKPLGPYEKVLVHEWGHLRYGVYDEYPTGNDPHFYNGPKSSVKATRCSDKLEGEMYDKESNARGCRSQGSLPDSNCRFKDFEGELEPEYASLMYRQYLSHVVTFCDNDPKRPKELHNSQAPNQQNIKCNGQSVWEVLRSHGDFNGVNLPRNISDTTPHFRVVQAQMKKYVLVLDVSGSMKMPATRIENLARGCSNFIRNVVRDGEMMGIVWFNAIAHRAHDIVTINNETRNSLLDAIPRDAAEGTSIGAGILEALDMLHDHGGTAGATLIVVSDGEENIPPFIAWIEDDVLEANVTVHSIAFTQNASLAVDELAKMTGGLSFLYTDNDRSNALSEAFRTIGDLNQNIRDKKLPISSEANTLAGGQSTSRGVSIDSTLGRNTEFIFDYSGAGEQIKVLLVSPRGARYDKTSPVVTHDSKFGLYTFTFSGVGETGRWTYSVTNEGPLQQKVAVTAVSMTAEAGKYPIIAQAFWGTRELDQTNTIMQQSIYASVSQGYSAVLSANVIAQVETPGGTTVELKLSDNGAGADQIKDDGIYSAYFVDFNGDGRYNVKVLVNSKEATRISSIRVIGRVAAAPNTAHTYTADVKVTHLDRTASGGSFELSNYQPGKVYPPGQVLDLELVQVNTDMGEVVLSWTAPGAEMDKGKVSEYEVRYSTDHDSLLRNFPSQTLVTPSSVRSGSLTEPGNPGEKETIAVAVPSKGEVTYVFGLVSKDLRGAGGTVTSPVSNLVSAGMKAYTPAPGAPGSGSGNKAGIIVGAIFGTVAFIAIVAVIVIVVVRWNRGNTTTPHGPA